MTGFLTHPEPDVHHRGDALGRSYTPDRCAEAIMRRLVPLFSADPIHVLEPCVGGGAFVRAARRMLEIASVTGFDLDPGAPGRGLCDTFVHADARGMTEHEYDLCVTNLPWGKDVGQDVTLELLARCRCSATWCSIILPVDCMAQAGFEAHMRETYAVWPLLPRPWNHERGVCNYVWGPQQGGRFWPLRWSSNGRTNNLKRSSLGSRG